MDEQDPQKMAAGLEKQADELEAQGNEVGARIADVRTDWESKRASPAVPGADPPEPEAEASGGGGHRESEQPRSPGPEAPPENEHPGT